MTANRADNYLGHMLDAIGRAMTYAEPFTTPGAFAQNQQAVDAAIRAIEILGEAANRLARSHPALLDAHPEVPWKEMRTMRNKLIHDYFEVDPLVVWQTVKADLPLLRAKLLNISQRLEPES